MGNVGGYARWLESQAKLDTMRRTTKGKLAYHDSSARIVSVNQTNPDTGITYSYDMRLAIVTPTTSYKPQRSDVSIVEYMYKVGIAYTMLNKLSGIIAVDIETKGTQAADPNCELIGIGIADASNIYYFDFVTNGKEVNQVVLDFLSNYKEGMVGHNVFFDGTFLQRECGKWLHWTHDTYGMYKQLASEGYASQKWGLKDAQVQLLKWDGKGDVELDDWLVKNGYLSDVKKDKKSGYVYLEKEDRWCKPRKSEMWRAPAQILGYYCALDAASTWQLLHECFLPSVKGQPFEDAYLDYHWLFMDNVRMMGAQQLSGISINQEMLQAHHEYLLASINTHYDEFVNHPDVRPIADEYNQLAIKELIDKEPVKYKKRKPLAKEPSKTKKNGEESKLWIAWNAKRIEYETTEPDISSHWHAWHRKVEEAKVTEHLNPNSSAQMQWLFYEKLGNEILIRTHKGGTTQPPKMRFSFKKKEYEPNQEYDKWLESAPATGAKSLPAFGEAGKLLKKQKDDVKEEGYVKACLEHCIDGRLHSQFRMPGTLTGRLAGSGGLNLQQIPKSRKYLECWHPLPGKAWVDCDHTSLEQVVLAELSRDPSLWKIYGPNAKPNDIYLFNGSQLPIIGAKIREAGYDPDNPTLEAIAHVKKVCKKERGISKVITLGSSYGMGWAKLQMTLKIQGIIVSEEEAQAMVKSYWDIYAGVKVYEKYLLKEYEENNGWVLNGIGRPVGVAKDYIKDIVNRVIQSTGHDIHMLYIMVCDQLLKEAGLQVNGIVWDFHDESIVECAEKDKDKVYQIMGYDAYRVLNERYLQGEIKLKGDPQHISNLADAKVEV